ncbi:MAG: DUF2065 domain-containing protein [Hyphomicrobiaceae bacterium]|nr:DUF2065 domain-containing protein [Hyphomicrobiaceae bacterium]
MTDLLVGIGLVFVIEGVLWAAFPGLAVKLLASAAQTPEQTLRTLGVFAAAVGVAIVWAVRG